MRLVAIETGWFQPVSRMATIARDLGVLALELVQLFLRAWMALAACVCQCGSHLHFLGGMRIRVTTQAIGYLCAVRLVMAGVALRHYGIVVSLFGVVDMECGVAFLTVKTVFCSLFLYAAKHAWVALTALLRC